MSHALIWAITAASIALMLLRPRNLPEWVPTCVGALAILVLRLLPATQFIQAIGEGADVYFFLTGMMLLAELARSHGVFDWLASVAVNQARGSRVRLFALLYAVGTLVTIFLSNDATAVVLTPAVLAAVRKAKAESLPYLFLCALVANAASFVLPVSNPANLVLFHGNVPALARWMRMFALPSIVSIAVTYAAMRFYFRGDLRGPCQHTQSGTKLSSSGKLTLACLGVVSVVLLVVSAMDHDLGLPTLLTAAASALFLALREKSSPLKLLRGISWSVLPLVAALFVLVEAVQTTGALHATTAALTCASQQPPLKGALAAGFVTGTGTNLVNNLPLGLLAGAGIILAHASEAIRKAMLLGIDLGPNLSVTGSLATILWLLAIRREGLHVSGGQFLKAGLVIMPPALLLAICAGLLTH